MLMQRSLVLVFLLSVVCNFAFGEVTIEITDVPPYEAAGNVQGVVTGPGSPEDYEVATYIQVEGSGWWVKPTEAVQVVPVNPDWTFTVPIGTGGLDAYATIYSTAVVDSGYEPPKPLGSEYLPQDAGFLAMDSQERYGHPLNKVFGVDRTTNEPLTWGIKHAPIPVGPGGNLFDPENAWVDEQNRLHLAITDETAGWSSAEVMMTEALGYGEYLFQSSTGVDGMDSKAVFGAFTWDPYGDGSLGANWRNREIDITEDSRSDIIADPDDSQYVVQPWNSSGHRYTYDLDESEITRVMIWQEDRLEFYTVQGHQTLDTWRTAPVIDSWTDYSDVIPQPGEARLRFNLWLYPPSVPAEDGSLEFIVDHFEYAPEPGVVYLLGAGAMMLVRRRRQRL